MTGETVKLVLAVLFGAGNATSMFLAVRGHWLAWFVVIVSQTLNITYLSLTEQWLVLAGGQPICLLIGIYGLQRWWRKGVRGAPARPAAPLAPTTTVRDNLRVTLMMFFDPAKVEQLADQDLDLVARAVDTARDTDELLADLRRATA